MPQKHAKNNCASKCFNHWERNEAASDGHYGTSKVRLGGDSQLTFGHCSLCVHPAIEPMATPSGHVYCKECIVEYLLSKTQELKRQREAFEEQERHKIVEGSKADEGVKRESEASFVSTQLIVAEPHVAEVRDKKRSRDAEDEGSQKRPATVIEKELTKQAVLATKEEKIEQLRSTSWWLPQFQPKMDDEKIMMPPKRPDSPMSGEPLRAKDLMSITFTIDRDKKQKAHIAGGDSDKGTVICPITRKGITTQNVVLIKRTGQVMLEDAAKQFAIPTMTCPVTGEKFKKKDIVPLISSGSSFAASGQVEVSKYAPALR